MFSGRGHIWEPKRVFWALGKFFHSLSHLREQTIKRHTISSLLGGCQCPFDVLICMNGTDTAAGAPNIYSKDLLPFLPLLWRVESEILTFQASFATRGDHVTWFFWYIGASQLEGLLFSSKDKNTRRESCLLFTLLPSWNGTKMPGGVVAILWPRDTSHVQTWWIKNIITTEAAPDCQLQTSCFLRHISTLLV